MRTVFFLLQKEFKQIFRNKSLLPIIFMMPIVQLIILPMAADYEVKNINLAIVDHDHSDYSRNLISKVTASGYFRLTGYNNSFKEAFQLIEDDKADLILEIPQNFEKDLIRDHFNKLLISVNAINGVKAGLGGNYLSNILQSYGENINLEWLQLPKFSPQPSITTTSSNWFNPFMNYNFFMVPGILAALVTMIGSYMTALNIVKEKEIGTIEQINVTPIRKIHFILGKLIPFLIIGCFVFSVGLWIISYLLYGIFPEGSIPLLYIFLFFYLFAIMGLGLLISTFAETQQQAMSVAFFFIMIFMLMSGLFTPIDSMPEWAKFISNCSPLTYFIEVMRMIVLKGSGFKDLMWHFFAILGIGIFLNGWAIINYKKTS